MTASHTSQAFDVADVAIRFDRRPADYQPGDQLEASILLAPACTTKLKSVELTVVWYTAGKGDEDLHVHEFVRHAMDGAPTKPREPSDDSDEESLGKSDTAGQRFELSTKLPRAPLSYAGVIVKVCWCVRVRLFDGAGRQSLIEQPFRLGCVEPATLVDTTGGAK